MASNNPVIWFEIPVNDLGRAKKFYESIFGYELSIRDLGPSLVGTPLEMAFFPMEQNGAGAGGTLVKSEGYTPSHEGTMVYFAVDDIEGVLKKVDQNRGKTLSPKTNIGEYGFIGLFQDTEGNRIGVHSMK